MLKDIKNDVLMFIAGALIGLVIDMGMNKLMNHVQTERAQIFMLGILQLALNALVLRVTNTKISFFMMGLFGSQVLIINDIFVAK